MKIPKNMTEDQVLEKIYLIIDRIAHKYAFGSYDINDIKQESFLICIDALDRYDQKRPLENFLAVNLSNRLKNFVRDNNFTKSDQKKRNVLLPMQLSNENTIADDKNLLELEDREIFQIIDDKIYPEYRADYLKMINGVNVSKKRREEIVAHIRELIGEDDA